MSDRDMLAGYVDAWAASVDDLLALLAGLDDAEWSRPTDLAGWDVKAVASHVAHLESLLAGGPEETAELGEAEHVRGPMGQFTEIGVLTRREREPASIVEEIRAVTDRRRAALAAKAPSDASAPAPGVFGAIGWNTKTLLRNRPLDVWMHEQDIRRAVGRPGGMDSAGAHHTADYLSESLGFVVGKRVRPPVGTTVVLEIHGGPVRAVAVGDDGRAQALDAVPDAPTVSIAMDRETFILAAGGRRTADPSAFDVEGDADLGTAIVAALAVTP